MNSVCIERRRPEERACPRRAGIGLVMLLAVVVLGTGCAPPGYHIVKPTMIDQATGEVPEDQLLNVGVAVSEVPSLSAAKLKKQGSNHDILASERRFIPYHLKRTLEGSSHWGRVHVVPEEEDTADLKVTSEVVLSNGEMLRYAVDVKDATGRVWLRRKYQAKVQAGHYAITKPGEHEAFQDLYNTVANDLAAFLRRLTPEEIEEIRTVSALKFAADFAPDAFDDYLVADRSGRWEVQRLPADDDPLIERIDRIRGRQEMFVDTLDRYYEGFYLEMWDAYENWRKFYLTEQVARREAEWEGFLRTLGGILMIAAGIGLQIGDVSNTGALSGILILGGGQVMVSGINVSEQVEIHAAAIEELAESFGSDMRPTVVELEGKQYELTGTADEQYAEWRALLRDIYREETGFDTDAAHSGGAGDASFMSPAGP